MTGQIVSHYRLLVEIGGGGMGVVYRAEDLRLKRQVALKFLSSSRAVDAAAIERFRREAEAVSALNHPYICTLHDVGEHDGRPFLVLELLEGRSLQRVLAAERLTVERTLRYALQIADALDAAHAKGIIHRDLKPSNLWVTTRDDIKILDFGVAKLAETPEPGPNPATTRVAVTASGDSVGTPQYMSPEQVRGEAADGRSDLFALGLVMYEMATGRPAFSGATIGVVLDAVLNLTPQPASAIAPTLPPALEQIVSKAIEKDPGLRYQSARDVMADVRRVLRDVAGTPTPPLRVPESSQRIATRRPARIQYAAGLLAVVVLAGLGVGGWFVSRSRSSPEVSVANATPGGPDRLVVLPFENQTQQPADAWLAGAFSDALSAGLQPLETIVLVPRERVVELYAAESRQESQALSSELARQISEKLRVRYYVHGSYQRVGDDLRVVARLVDAERDAIEAQETLTNRIANVFALEDELASRFASRLGGQAAKTSLGEPPPLDAYQAVVDARARYALGRFSEARALLQRAVDGAPRYALAWAWLSKADSRLGSPASFEESRRRTELLRQALAEATTAVTLEPGLVDGEVALALVYRGLVQTPAQRAAAERAFAADPRNAEALGLMAESYSISASYGCPNDPRPELAEQQYRDALTIDPLNNVVRNSLATHLWWMNRQPEAFAVQDEGRSIMPDNVQNKTWHPFNMAFAGRADEALAQWRRNTGNPSELGAADAFVGGIIELKRRNFTQADGYFRNAGSQFTDTLPFPLIAAVTNFQVGRMAEGATLLERGFQANVACVAWFDRVPAFAPFKSDPAVKAVLARVRRR
jgi:serine/threonine protein kinase/tetratricopeptide (TPR) repeat protein